MITEQTPIRDILVKIPGSQQLLMDRGVRYTGWSVAFMTLEQAARGKNVDLKKLITDLTAMQSQDASG